MSAPKRRDDYSAIAITIGIVAGLLLGVILGNIGAGIAFGGGLGAAGAVWANTTQGVRTIDRHRQRWSKTSQRGD